MGAPPTRALFQSFLPGGGKERAHVWKFSWEYGGRRPLHFHAEPELNLVLSGTAMFRIGETTVRASREDVLAFPPGMDHALLETSPDVYLFAIGMDSRFSSEVLRAHHERTALPLHIRLAAPDFASLVARSESIVDRQGIDQLAAELWEQGHWLRQRHADRSKGPMHVLARRALSLLAEQPDLEGELVARKARASACELSRYFHRDLGMTFVKYRTRLRLLRLISLVDEDRGNLMASAKAAGFGSYSQCHRTFQAELNCSPRQFFHGGLRAQMQMVYEP